MDHSVTVASNSARSPRALEDERRLVRDWLESLDGLHERLGPEFLGRLLPQLQRRAAALGAPAPEHPFSPVNSVPREAHGAYPGDPAVEARIEAAIRWNALAMVARANETHSGIGGHLSTFASAATLFEVGFNHVFRGDEHPEGPDLVFFQGHASPGVYARAHLEGRLDEAQLDRFRREVGPESGLSSYPHPWLMPDFWQVPSVSMGLAPVMAVHAARFARFLHHHERLEHPGRVWALVGDGEMDEPESVGALALAGREHLGNLSFVVNCNLQRLDGPVRPAGRVVEELERLFEGAGWHVIKVLWGSPWDAWLEDDDDGRLLHRLSQLTDLDLQRYVVQGAPEIREHFLGGDPALARRFESITDAELLAAFREGRGGHDPVAVLDGYREAEAQTERPSVILALTVKGFGFEGSAEGRNVAHKTKSLDLDGRKDFRARFDLPVSDEQLESWSWAELDAEAQTYLEERRAQLGGPLPRRRTRAAELGAPERSVFDPYLEEADRPATTTMVMVRMLADLMDDETVGPAVVPIVPDEARTFGIEALFGRYGIYGPHEPERAPVDAETLTPYRVTTGGRVLEEGITESGALSSAIAAGIAHCTHGVHCIPFYFFYSMFGFQRVGDLLWAAGDARARGFLLGATSGRTTLNGEGLQHQDGHSHVLAGTHPRVRAYDPAFGYEVATLVAHGLGRMLEHDEDLLFYLTLTNEPGEQPGRPDGAQEGIIRGLYRLAPSQKHGEVRRVNVLASGPMVRLALRAQERLEEEFGVTTDVWSVTSWTELYRDCRRTARHNRLNPNDRRESWLEQHLGDDPGAVVTVSDYMACLGHQLAPWIRGSLVSLGTDGFGRSDTREALRDFFEVDDRHITQAALHALARVDRYPHNRAVEAIESLGLNPRAPDPSNR